MTDFEGGAERRGARPGEMTRENLVEILLEAQGNLKLYTPSEGVLLRAIGIVSERYAAQIRKEKEGRYMRQYYPGREFQREILRSTILEGLHKSGFFDEDEKKRWAEEVVRVLDGRYAR